MAKGSRKSYELVNGSMICFFSSVPGLNDQVRSGAYSGLADGVLGREVSDLYEGSISGQDLQVVQRGRR